MTPGQIIAAVDAGCGWMKRDNRLAIMAYLLRQQGLSYPAISRAMGWRSHGTAHGVVRRAMSRPDLIAEAERLARSTHAKPACRVRTRKGDDGTVSAGSPQNGS